MAKNLLQNTCDAASIIKVSSQTVSSVASVQFTGLDSYPFKNYRIIMSHVVLSTTAAVYLQLSSNNGSSYINTGYQGGINLISWSSGFGANSNITNAMFLIYNHTSGASIGGTYDIFNLNINTALVMLNGSGQVFNTLDTYTELSISSYLTLITANAFQILPSTGTFSGTFTIYGYVE